MLHRLCVADDGAVVEEEIVAVVEVASPSSAEVERRAEQEVQEGAVHPKHSRAEERRVVILEEGGVILPRCAERYW